MPQENSRIRKLMRAALAGGFGALLVVSGSIGHALAEEDEEEDLPDVKFFKSLLSGLGLKKGGVNSDINYHERSPLVVPPSTDLPVPESEATRKLDPSFPIDQDTRRRQEAAKRRKQENRPIDADVEGRPLTPDELARGRGKPKNDADDYRSAATIGGYDRPLSPTELGFKGFKWDVTGFFGKEKDEVANFESEPPRTSLTEPPAGYRTPSAAQPYGLRKEAVKGKATTLEDRASGESEGKPY